MADRTEWTRRELLTACSLAAGVGIAGCLGNDDGQPGGYTMHEAPDGREYARYIPDNHDGTEKALVVALHGCGQDVDEFSEGTRFNAAAEANDAVVAYPQQTRRANILRCWNWFEEEHITRGSGEIASIGGVIEDVTESVAIDHDRVYVMGFSAGAAMVPNLLFEYPDTFAAGSMQAGLQYQAVEAPSQAYGFQRSAERGLDPVEQGITAYEAMGERAAMVPLFVLHGTADDTVHPQNGQDAVTQAITTNDLAHNGEQDGSVDTDPDLEEVRTAPEYEYTYREYQTPEAETVVASIFVDGMGHGWAGGVEGGSNTSPGGPSMTEYTFEFFEGRTLENPSGM